MRKELKLLICTTDSFTDESLTCGLFVYLWIILLDAKRKELKHK